MTGFFLLPGFYRNVLSLLLFFALAAEISLLLFKISNHAPVKNCLRCVVMMTANGVMLLCSAQKPPASAFAAAFARSPWLIYAVLILMTAVHFAISFPREKQRAKNSISPNSIREAVDNLPMGVCFADPVGRCVLINKKMQEIAGELFGFCPQMLGELTEALTAPKNGTLLPDGYIHTERGGVYRFRTDEHTVDGRPGWRQVMAYDVTERYAVSEQLRLENDKLKKINHKLQKMYQRMSDDIRKKESLELKIYVHDTIGRSLLTIRDIIDSGRETQRKVQALQEAVGVLSVGRTSFAGTMDEARRIAAKMGVKIHINGYIPAGTVIESLAAVAARECTTNCVKHAKGNEITVTAACLDSIFRIGFTNNGEKPKGKIIEGSGLSTLRRSVEASGGEMAVSCYPAFRLTLNLPRKEAEE